MTTWVDLIFELDGEEVEIDYALHMTLNHLASKLYKIRGYEVESGHDFYASSHPAEKETYAMALTSYVFNICYGLD